MYRNLTRFKEQGLIVSLGTVNGVERFDGNISRHAHFICRRCGRVGDLAMPDLPVPGLNGAQNRELFPEAIPVCAGIVCEKVVRKREEVRLHRLRLRLRGRGAAGGFRVSSLRRGARPV